jgi:hypothetical protein
LQFLQRAALRPVPAYAVVDENALAQLENSLDEDEDRLQDKLDQAFRELDRLQPDLGRYLTEELSKSTDDIAQSLGYFLIVTVFMAFREAFPTRLGSVTPDGLEAALASLAADEALRAEDPNEVLESDDVLAMGQPALIDFVQEHVQEALEVSPEDTNLDDLDNVYRAILVEVIALSHAVQPGPGEPEPIADGGDSEILA